LFTNIRLVCIGWPIASDSGLADKKQTLRENGEEVAAGYKLLMAASLNAGNGQRTQAFALIAGLSGALLGRAALAWASLDVDALKRIVPGSTPLKPNIAAGLFLCGAGLALLSHRKISELKRAYV
jgi:hypothetical protein